MQKIKDGLNTHNLQETVFLIFVCSFYYPLKRIPLKMYLWHTCCLWVFKKDGCSPFKAETAQFIKSNSVLKETFRDEVKLFGHISKKSVAGIITTNYDMFFEKYLSGYKVFIGQNELLFSQLQGVAEVYKIHGSVLNPQSIVINENDYKEFKEHKEYLAAKLLTIFMEYPIVFIGYSLSDSNIIDILSSIVKCMDNDKF